MNRIDQFVEMQGQIREYLELYTGSVSVYEISIDNSYGTIRIGGSSGEDGDQWTDERHESAWVDVPADFFKYFDEYYAKLKYEKDMERAETLRKNGVKREKYDREQLAKLKEKYE